MSRGQEALAFVRQAQRAMQNPLASQMFTVFVELVHVFQDIEGRETGRDSQSETSIHIFYHEVAERPE